MVQDIEKQIKQLN
ncbi:Protein of unknown function [Bacillus thuringiensis]|uniref:Uncharacterized protein n=1 Tax=Bacillus thuringiensis TaxID=1428 RepID=A0A1C4DZP3_BACTU|nr:Protein of unknown function [Bacillus thuringiensis]